MHSQLKRFRLILEGAFFVSPLRFLMSYIKRHKWQYILGIITLFIVDYANLFIPELTGEVTDGLTSLDAGNWTFHMEEVNVDTLLINLYTKFEPICNGKNIVLQLDIAEESYPPLFSDNDRLDQIISVFLDNAVSYSPSSSKITLGASVEKYELVITVTDHGVGISDKDKPYIFNRFYQCDKSRTQREHFGLGLSIAHELVDKMSGKIRLFNTDGGGCTFKIYLPFS